MQIDINELAPWVAIAVTLILSILVPLFTQIANNRFQLKKAKQDRKLDEEKEKLSKKTDAYEHFLMDVGAAITFATKENLPEAGASIGRLLLYVPVEWHGKLDALFHNVRTNKWGEAEMQFSELAKLVSEEYGKIEEKPTKKK